MLAKKAASKGWEREALGGKGDEWWCYNCAALGHLGDVSTADFTLADLF